MRNMLLIMKSGMRLSMRQKMVVLSMLFFPVFSTFLPLVTNYGMITPSKEMDIAFIFESENPYTDLIFDAIDKDTTIKPVKTTHKPDIDVQERLERAANGTTTNFFIFIHADIEARLSNGEELMTLYTTGADEREAILQNTLQSITKRLKLYYNLTDGDLTETTRLMSSADEQTFAITVENLAVVEAETSDVGNKLLITMGFLSWFAIWGSSYIIITILKEQDLKVYKRFMLAGLKTWSYFTAKLALAAMIGAVQVALMLISFKYVVKIDDMIPYWQLGLLLFGFMLVSIGINLAVVSFCKNRAQVTTITVMLINITAMVSGSYFPYDIMPEWMQRLSYFMPQRWIVHTINRLSAGIDGAMLEYAAVMLGFIALLTAISLTGFKLKSRNTA